METPPFSPLLFFLFLLISSLPIGKPDLLSDKAALQALQAAVGRSVLSWNDSNSPCTWKGVKCESGRVTILRLPAVGLMGQLPPGAVGNLTKLRTLSLRINALTGGLPPDLVSCVELRYLYLQDNQFSGEIPPFLFLLQNLIRINLAGNGFSGGIKPGFNNLTRLGTLYLDRNQLSGQIPDMNLNLVQFNVSYNQLNGSIPVKLQSMPANAFLGTSLCGGPLLACPGAVVPVPEPSGQTNNGNGSGSKNNNNNLSGGAIAGIAVGSAVGLLILVALLLLLCRRKRKGNTGSVEATKPPEVEVPIREKRVGEGVNRTTAGAYPTASAAAAAAVGAAAGAKGKRLVFFGSGPRVFDLEDLLSASAEVLGKGTFGTAYKAVLQMGTVVAVKRLKDVNLSEKEFKDKIEAVGAMDHPNLVALRAYYFSKDEKLLVYDYMSMGSLSALLHGNRGSGHTPLDWQTRANIALASARGIEYIHSRGPGASHGNIKSSNILLAKSYDARVSDHGLAHLVSPTSMPNRVSGYRAPEVTDARKVSQKADVYSFGVLLLELLTGKAPAQAILNEEGVDLPRWVQSVVREEWTAEVFDFELLRYQNVEEEMVQLLQLAIDCCAQYPDQRPTMSDVVARIGEIRQPINLNQQHRPAVDAADEQPTHRTQSPDRSGPPA